MKSRRRKTLLLFSGLIIFIFIVGVSVNFYSNFYIRKLFKEAVLKNDSLPYEFGFDHLHVNVWTGYVCAESIYVNSREDSTSQQENSFHFNASSLTLSGINIPALLFRKTLYVSQIRLEHPAINASNRDSAKKKNNAAPFNFYNLIRSRFDSLRIGTLTIVNGEATVSSGDTADMLLSVPAINLNMTGLRIDSSLAFSGKIIDAATISLSLENIHGHFQKGLYNFSLPLFTVASGDSIITIDSLFLHPAVGKKEFAAKAGFQTDCINLKLVNIQLHSGKILDSLLSESLFFDNVEIGSLQLHDYRDKNIPRRPGEQALLQASLKSLPFRLTILEILLHNGNITYEELAPGATGSGHIDFNKITATMTNITNVRMKDTLKISASGFMMNEAAISSLIQFPLAENNFFASIDMGSFDMRALNPMIMNFAPVKIAQGQARKMKTWFSANETRGSGQMTFTYSGLEVSPLSEEKPAKGNILKGIEKFIANGIVLEQDNPKNNLLRVGKIDYERNPQRNIINYIWNLIFSGFKSSIGLKEEKLKKQLQT